MLPPDDLHDALLPLGRLREPPSSLRRADAVVVSPPTSPLEENLGLQIAPDKTWTARRVLQADQVTGTALAFCGIARPEQFFTQLKSHDMQLVSTIAFPDHHRYSGTDIDRLLKAKQAWRAEYFITTEKDFINLAGLGGRLQPLHVASVRLVLEADNFLDTVIKTLEERCGCRF